MNLIMVSYSCTESDKKRWNESGALLVNFILARLLSVLFINSMRIVICCKIYVILFIDARCFGADKVIMVDPNL
jgi:hypothetical protein